LFPHPFLSAETVALTGGTKIDTAVAINVDVIAGHNAAKVVVGVHVFVGGEG
jgi:hypothetical protein